MGFPPIPERVPKSAENRTFCAKRVQKMRKKCGSPHFSALFLESAETPLFVQINVFAILPLRLDRKYTTLAQRMTSPVDDKGMVAATLFAATILI